MKCPDCGTELHGKDICGRCGRKVARPQKDVEVEYKEFPLSEFLEIRKKHGSQDTDTDSAASENSNVPPIFPETAAPGLKSGKEIFTTAETKKEIEKNRKLFFLMLILIITVIVTGGFFILKSLFKL